MPQHHPGDIAVFYLEDNMVDVFLVGVDRFGADLSAGAHDGWIMKNGICNINPGLLAEEVLVYLDPEFWRERQRKRRGAEVVSGLRRMSMVILG